MPDTSSGRPARETDLTVRPDRSLQRMYGLLAPARRRALGSVAAAARRSSMRVYLVGGAVRDLLLRRPPRDLDVTVEGDVRILARQLGGPISGYSEFGTCTVRPGYEVEIDLARARRESYRRPAALPEVEPAGLADDLSRRDFTINAMAAPLGERGLAGLIDPFGGLEDLRRGRIRVLHDRSFQDDPTRAFRAAIVASDLGGRVGRPSVRWIRDAVEDGVFDLLSAARLREAFRRALESAGPGEALRLLGNWGVVGAIDARLRVHKPVVERLQRLPRVVLDHRKVHSDEPLSVWSVAAALVLHASGEPVVEAVLSRLRPSRGEATAIRRGIAAQANVPRAIEAWGGKRASAIHAACRGEPTEALLAVRVAATSPAVRRAVRSFLDRLRDVRADIDGEDLLEKGVRPGPALARGLEAALAAKLDGKAPRKADQLRIALAAAGRS